MNGYRSLRNTAVIISFLFAISATLFGCAYNADLTYSKAELPDTMILDKLPLKAALYIPESTRNYTQPTDVSRGCLAMHVTGRFGQIFAETVEGTLKQVFEDLTIVRRPAAGTYDILVEADMTEYIYKAGCMGNPGSYGIVNGHIRALDGNGREIWRSKETSKRSSFTGLWEVFVPESITSLVGAWAQELTSQPQIRQLQKKTP
ncbi:MAG: hypothetical protein QME06_04060 [Desulfobacterales bacterium]|nr:hypothetical protein [Desulfobacterales bacterium]